MKEFQTLEKLESATEEYLKTLVFLPELKVCDHICYICKSDESYKEWISRVSELGQVVKESNGAELGLAGKNFLIVKLNESTLFMNMPVSILEIKQSDNPDFLEDWQHAEFITSTPLNEIIGKNPGVDFESKRVDDPSNPEIGIRFSKQYSVKFRSNSLSEQ